MTISTNSTVSKSYVGSRAIENIDNIDQCSYEKESWGNILSMPILWAITIWVAVKKKFYSLLKLPTPRINSIWFDGFGSSPRIVKEGNASWRALDEIYNYQFGKDRSIFGLLSDCWEKMINCKALRNRLKLIKREVKRAIMRFSDSGEVRLVSLAAGSAQGIIEIMAELKKEGIKVRALLVDIDPSALAYAKELATRYGVNEQIETILDSVLRARKRVESFKPQVVEMLGYLDYCSKNIAIKLIKGFGEAMSEGIFLTCNIQNNFERRFLKYVVNWDMIYRAPADLIEIIEQTGFVNYQIVYEPMKIHGLIVAQK
jgi:hypothetical protein